MAVQKHTVVLFLAVALVAGPATSYAADAGYAPATPAASAIPATPAASATPAAPAVAGAAPAGKKITMEQNLIEKINAGFKASVAVAAGVPPADKYKTFVKTFSAAYIKALVDAIKEDASPRPLSPAEYSARSQLTSKLTATYKLATEAAQGATPEAKYDAYVGTLSEGLRVIAGTLEVHAVKPAAEEVKGIPAAATTTAATATPAAVAGGYKV